MTITNGYASLNQLKDFVESDVAASAHDDDLERAVEAASRAIDTYCGRFFYKITPASARIFRARDPYELDVPDFHTTTDLVVETDTTDDGTYDMTWVAADYQVEPFDPQDGWPWNLLVAVDTELFPTGGRRARVRVTAQWGWNAVPREVESTCLIAASELWQRKNAPFGVMFSGGDPARIAASELPVLARLDGYARLGIAAI